MACVVIIRLRIEGHPRIEAEMQGGKCRMRGAWNDVRGIEIIW